MSYHMIRAHLVHTGHFFFFFFCTKGIMIMRGLFVFRVEFPLVEKIKKWGVFLMPFIR